jgi:hypothetical protein
LDELDASGAWRTAVWVLRFGYLVLGITAAGLIVALAGGTRWILGVGVLVWLACAAVILTSFLLARSKLREPRPDLWSMRMALIRATVRGRTSG